MTLDAKDEVEVPLAPIKQKLSELKLKSPYGQQYTLTFAKFLSTQLCGEIIFPSIFLFEVEMAFTNLRRGTDRFGKRLSYQDVHFDADRVSAAEPIIRADLPAILDACCTKKFAQQAKEILSEALAAA